MLEAATIILAVLGALGGIILVVRWMRSGIRYWKRRRLYRDAPQDYYYRCMEVAERWSQPGKAYLSHRHAQITSLSHGLAGMKTGVGHNDFLNYELTISPSEFELRKLNVGSTMREWDEWEVIPPDPLRKSQKAEYQLAMSATARPDKELPDSTSFLTDRRMDKLVLRTSFAADPPTSVIYKVYDVIGNVVASGPMKIAALTNEAAMTFNTCRPGYTYAIEWYRTTGA